MDRAADVIAWARSQLGTVETGGPHGNDGNIVIYWPEIHLPSYEGQPWCDAFVSAAFLINGVPVPVMTYAPTSESWYRARGRLLSPSQAAPGDQGFASWASDGVAPGHTWIVVENNPLSRTMVTIEGNTSSGTGTVLNGGGVYQRVRTYAECRSVGRPPYDLSPASPALPPAAPVYNRFLLDGVPTVQTMITLPTDSNGSGWIPEMQNIDVNKMVAATVQGAAPARDKRYFPGSAHWQNENGHPLFSVTGCLPNTWVNVFIAYGE